MSVDGRGTEFKSPRTSTSLRNSATSRTAHAVRRSHAGSRGGGQREQSKGQKEPRTRSESRWETDLPFSQLATVAVRRVAEREPSAWVAGPGADQQLHQCELERPAEVHGRVTGPQRHYQVHVTQRVQHRQRPRNQNQAGIEMLPVTGNSWSNSLDSTTKPKSTSHRLNLSRCIRYETYSNSTHTMAGTGKFRERSLRNSNKKGSSRQQLPETRQRLHGQPDRDAQPEVVLESRH